MKGKRVLHSSQSDLWATPRAVFDALSREFNGFDLDAAASDGNALCRRYITEAEDALAVPWCRDGDEGMRVWLNPPYSRCREFIAKASAEAARGCLVVCLVPARTDTRWWHAHVWDVERNGPRDGVEVRFVKGRLKFGDAAAGAPFPSVVIVFHPHVPAESVAA